MSGGMGQLRFVLLGFACVLVLAASAGATPANGKVAFVRDDSSGHAQIWIVNPDGSHEAQVTSDAVDHFDPKWSPDGTELAYTSYPTPGNFSNSDIYVATIDAGGALGTPTQLTTSTSSDTNPAWSPDGTQIAWAHAGNIWVMNADGSGQTQLTHDGFSNFDTEPSWSPSGAEIAYEHQVLNGDYDVRAVASDGSSNRLIVGTGNFE